MQVQQVLTSVAGNENFAIASVIDGPLLPIKPVGAYTHLAISILQLLLAMACDEYTLIMHTREL